MDLAGISYRIKGSSFENITQDMAFVKMFLVYILYFFIFINPVFALVKTSAIW